MQRLLSRTSGRRQVSIYNPLLQLNNVVSRSGKGPSVLAAYSRSCVMWVFTTSGEAGGAPSAKRRGGGNAGTGIALQYNPLKVY